jgi:hypothetical protein
MSRRTCLEQISRLAATFGLAFSLCFAGLAAVCARADERSTNAPAPPNEFPYHLRALQQRLGGSVVDQFDSLRPESVAPAWWKQFRGSLDAQGGIARPAPAGSFGTPTWGATWSGTTESLDGNKIFPAAANAPVSPVDAPAPQAPFAPASARVITALREVAARLDGAANRLEGLELYGQADSLREEARELRVDARRRSASGGAVIPTPAYPSITPVPTLPSAPRYVPPTPLRSDPPRTSSSGSWRLNWVGPTDQSSGQSAAADEPAIQPVWSEDRDSAGEFDPSAVPTPITPTPAQ